MQISIATSQFENKYQSSWLFCCVNQIKSIQSSHHFLVIHNATVATRVGTGSFEPCGRSANRNGQLLWVKLTGHSSCNSSQVHVSYWTRSHFFFRHKVVSVVPKSDENFQLLKSFEQQGVIKFWTEPSTLNRPASFQVSSSQYELISGVLADQGLTPTVLITDIQEWV